MIGEEIYLFAVFDGHGGNQVADYAKEFFKSELLLNTNYLEGNYETALIETFTKIDDDMLKEAGAEKLKSYTKKETDENSFTPYEGYEPSESIAQYCGCTAWVCLIVDNTIYCANAGDSRCVLSKNKTAIPMSFDHKPSNPEEEKRINEAGGTVEWDRVNGNLNLSRALGDFTYKENQDLKPSQQMVLWTPDVKIQTIDKDTEFMIIACDGIWDCMTNQEAVDFISTNYDKLK